jgi:hypothetical protein
VKKEDFVKNHNHINYCEAIIHPSGEIEYARPSHVQSLIRISGHTSDELYKMMERSMMSPLDFLLDMTKCVCVWYDFYQAPKEITKKQKETLFFLMKNKVMKTVTIDGSDGYGEGTDNSKHVSKRFDMARDS